MKRFVIVLLAIAVATFAFGEGFGMKAYVQGGVVEPGMVGTSVGGYYHNPITTGFDVKLGVRKPLADFFEMPDYLPLVAQVGLGFQMNSGKGFIPENMMAIELNIDALYNLNEVVNIPIVGVAPFLGLKYDAQLYETYMVSVLGLQLGTMVCYDLSDLLVEGLGVELILGNTFDFALSSMVPRVFLSQAYANLGVSYAFEF
ncbi:MAG: hypothetical protein U9O95_00605 [Candidatus Marinimicrobia bacterium]|nr:hypothetical protein [Candidatus Neomarinimicrobiota bacterium]